MTDEAATNCSQVRVHYILGHDTHGHPLSTTAGGCTGTIQTTASGHNPGTDNITAVFVAEYTDAGGLGPAATRSSSGRTRNVRFRASAPPPGGVEAPGRTRDARASGRPPEPVG